MNDFFEVQNRVSRQFEETFNPPYLKVFSDFQDRQARFVQEIQKVLDAPARQARFLKKLSNPIQKVLDDRRRIRASVLSSLSVFSSLS